MKPKATHKKNLVALNRAIGQMRGVQGMIEDEKYCIDIVNQIHAVVNALYRISENILAKHIEICLADAFKCGKTTEKDKKISELMSIVKRLHSIH